MHRMQHIERTEKPKRFIQINLYLGIRLIRFGIFLNILCKFTTVKDSSCRVFLFGFIVCFRSFTRRKCLCYSPNVRLSSITDIIFLDSMFQVLKHKTGRNKI